MSEIEFLVKLRDAAQMIADAAAEYLEKISPVDKSTWDPSKIVWTEHEGSKGPYERSEDVNNPDFKSMLQDLQDHHGKMNREGRFYWIFPDGQVVGRTPKREKKEGGS